MEVLHTVVLAVVQGVTEFLPVSSSAHLILVPKLFNWPDQGLSFDIAVHCGSLLAVLHYFRQELMQIFRAAIAPSQWKSAQGQLFWFGVMATIPAALGGLFIYPFVKEYLRSPHVIAYTTLIFGLLLWKVDAWARSEKTLEMMKGHEAFFIGVCQMAALIPGVSRSGVTLTAGRFLGFSPATAATFSFLLSIPVIILTGLKQALEIYQYGFDLPLQTLILGVAVSAIAASICIRAFMKLLQTVGLMPFVIYRLCLAGVLFYAL